MANRYAISATYYTSTVAYAELPENKTWDDVLEWYIKWDSIYILFKEEQEFCEYNLDMETSNITDWKRPLNCEIFNTDKNGEIIWEEEIDSD